MSDVAEQLRAIRASRGRLTPPDVVDAARPPTSLLHEHFEWDESAAAEAYRCVQAGALIRSIKVIYATEEDGTERRTRAFLAVREHAGAADFMPVEDVAADAFALKLVQREMRRDIAALQRRYGHLEDFAAAMAEAAA